MQSEGGELQADGAGGAALRAVVRAEQRPPHEEVVRDEYYRTHDHVLRRELRGALQAVPPGSLAADGVREAHRVAQLLGRETRHRLEPVALELRRRGPPGRDTAHTGEHEAGRKLKFSKLNTSLLESPKRNKSHVNEIEKGTNEGRCLALFIFILLFDATRISFCLIRLHLTRHMGDQMTLSIMVE